jgi:hypothetical protein
MDGLGADGVLRHDVPTHWVMRALLICGGVAILVLTSHELFRAVWPPNLLSLPFFAIVAGAALVGFPMIGAGLLAPSVNWRVSPGLVEITTASPFARKTHRIAAHQVERFEIREDTGDGVSSFKLVMTIADGTHFPSRDFGSYAAADDLRRQMQAILHRKPR